MNIELYLEEFDSVLQQRTQKISQSLQNYKPKLKINKVPEDLRTVRVKLNIPIKELVQEIEEIAYIPYTFDWCLNDQHISPKEFIQQLCLELEINIEQSQKLEKELVFQLVEYIERHSFEYQKPEQTIDLFNSNPIPEKRRPGRPLKNKQLQPIPPPPPPKTLRQSLKSNVSCLNCQFANTQAGYDCKRCRMPFSILEQLNLGDTITQVCVNYYEIVSQRLGSISYSARSKKQICKEDFTSLYKMRDKLKEIVNAEGHIVIDQSLNDILKNGGPLQIERDNQPKRYFKQRFDQMMKDSSSSESQQEKQGFQKIQTE